MKINKIELKHFIITIFFVTFALAFDDKNPSFVLTSWLSNFIKIGIFVTITVFVHYLGHKLAARRYQTEIEHRIMTMSTFYLSNFFSIKTKPIGIILSLFISFVSLGKLFYIAVESFVVKPSKNKRVGFRYTNLTNYETAVIAASGPLANLIFALIIKLFGVSSLDNLVFINLVYGLYHLIPFSTLDGCKLFFSSFILYIFTLFLLLGTTLLISFFSVTATIILVLFIASVFTIIFFFAMFGHHL